MGLISRKYVAEIIEARVEEIFEKIDEELKKIDRSGMLPAGVFLVGGGSKLTDLVETAKRKLRLPVSLGNSRNINTIIDKVHDQEFLNALGLVVWGDHLSGSHRSKWPGGDTVGKTVDKMKKWFSSIIP